MHLFKVFSPTCFCRYSGHLQGDIITRSQKYKCDYMCRHHSITIKIIIGDNNVNKIGHKYGRASVGYLYIWI